MNRDSAASLERRSFLSRLNTGIASLAAMAGVAKAQPSKDAPARWEPARHSEDAWLDKASVKHRLLFDTTEIDGVGDAIAFADNFYKVNKADYGLENSDQSIVIVLRHRSAAFGYNDSMWDKYGPVLAARCKVSDPKTKKPPTANLYNASGYGDLLPNRGITLESMAKLGAQFAVCTLSTRAIAGMIAHSTGSTPNEIFTELHDNLVTSARLVPAGVVAVSRAQEHGYTLVTC